MPRSQAQFLYQVLVWRLLICFISGSLLLASVGCGASSDLPDFVPELVPISGTVTLNQQPLIGAAVTFYPTGTEAVRAAYGLTDEQGKFTLMTPIRGLSPDRSQGAVPGQYRVIINKLTMKDGSPIPEGMTHADAMQQGAVESLSWKYSHQDRSTLTAEVTPASTEHPHFTFDLVGNKK